jgi:tetratricopeptide (TPR) repeat protein
MLCEQARFLNEQALYGQAIQIAQQALLDKPPAVVMKGDTPERQIYPLTTNAHLELGRALWRQGEYAAARQHADMVIQQAQAEGLFLLLAEGLRLQAGIHVELGESDKGKPLFEAALTIYQQAGDLLSESTVLHNLGLMMRRMAEFATAQQYYEQALTAREAIGYRQGMALTYNNLGALAGDRGDVSQAIVYSQQALSIGRQIGDRYVEGMALINLGINHHDQGIYDAARRYYAESLLLCQETGNRRLEGLTRQMIVLLLCHLDEYAAALPASDQLMDLAEALNDQAMINYAWLCRGHSLLGLQEWDAALAAYEQALAGWEGELLIFQMEPRTGVARTHFLQGKIHLARQAIEPVLAFLDAGHSLDGLYEPLKVYLICYEVLKASGEGERGRGFLATAHTILQERAAKISDETMRHSFLTHVPIHRELIAAYEKEQTSPSP